MCEGCVRGLGVWGGWKGVQGCVRVCEGKQGCVRTLPCFDEVVVTDMASCPPPAIMYGQLASGDKHAELSGLSESKHLSRLSVLASKRRT